MQPSSSSSSFLCYYLWYHLNFSFCVRLCVSHFPHFAASLGGSESDIYPQLSHRILWETLCIHCSSCTRSTHHRACACITLTPHNTIINIQCKHRFCAFLKDLSLSKKKKKKVVWFWFVLSLSFNALLMDTISESTTQTPSLQNVRERHAKARISSDPDKERAAGGCWPLWLNTNSIAKYLTFIKHKSCFAITHNWR